jgi:hypothetical protein
LNDLCPRRVCGIEEGARSGISRSSLNKGLATVKLKPGNTVSLPQLCGLIREKGYTPKTTTVSVRGDLETVQGRLRLRVSGTNESLTLVADPKNPAAYHEAGVKNTVQNAIIQGVMVPGKDLRAPVPLQVSQIK